MKITTTILILASFLVHGAQKSTELLKEVDPNKAQRLIEYNETFLLDALYFSKRHRIVEANTELLLDGGDFTITPFDDVVPLHIRPEIYSRAPDKIKLKAFIQDENSSQATGNDLFPFFLISAFAWDLDESGNAFLSIDHRFKHSQHWEIDESGTPRLETLPNDVPAVAGPPPTTPEDIEHHEKLKKLKKHQFYSVDAIFTSPEGKKYILKPLKYTPKYSVILEVDNNEMSWVRFDREPNERDNRSNEDRVKEERYIYFRNSLIREEGKAIKGDLQ